MSLASCDRSKPQGARPLAVDVIAVQPAEFRREVATISTLDAVEAVQLAAQAGGRIQELRIRQGDRVRPGQLLVVLDQAQLQAEVMSLRSASRQPLVRGRVDSIDPSVNVGNQVLLVKAAYTNGDGSLRNGLRVRTRLVLDSRSALSVPVGCVIQSSGQSYVWRVGGLRELERDPGQADLQRLRQLPPQTRFALQTRVQLGPLQDGRYPVLSGLAVSDQVISSNLISLRHGLPVEAVAAAAGGSPAARR